MNKSKINTKNSKIMLFQGFTLAEVLITLAIIGIVATLTIPSLVTSVQDNQFKIAYKKAYSDASQAIQSLAAEEMLVPTIMYGDPGNKTNFTNFMNKFIVVNQCLGTDKTACWAPNEPDTSLTAYTYPFGNINCVCFVDNQGRHWCSSSQNSYFILDTNGFKGPNIFGKDRAVIWIDSSNMLTSQIRNKLNPFSDYNGAEPHWCPAGNCYYTSWLTGGQ